MRFSGRRESAERQNAGAECASVCLSGRTRDVEQEYASHVCVCVCVCVCRCASHVSKLDVSHLLFLERQTRRSLDSIQPSRSSRMPGPPRPHPATRPAQDVERATFTPARPKHWRKKGPRLRRGRFQTARRFDRQAPGAARARRIRRSVTSKASSLSRPRSSPGHPPSSSTTSPGPARAPRRPSDLSPIARARAKHKRDRD